MVDGNYESALPHGKIKAGAKVGHSDERSDQAKRVGPFHVRDKTTAMINEMARADHASALRSLTVSSAFRSIVALKESFIRIFLGFCAGD